MSTRWQDLERLADKAQRWGIRGFAIETRRGRLVEFLLAQGFQVWHVRPNAMPGFRAHKEQPRHYGALP